MEIFMARNYFLAAAAAALASDFFLLMEATGGFQPFGRFLDSRMTM
jgi:hypothetical protein